MTQSTVNTQSSSGTLSSGDNEGFNQLVRNSSFLSSADSSTIYSLKDDIQSSQNYEDSEVDENLVRKEINGLSVEAMRCKVQSEPLLANQILSHYAARHVVNEIGWCKVLNLVPTKKNGYAQLSWEGVGKFASLQEVVLWASGNSKIYGEDCSHLCGQPLCLVTNHVIPERSLTNQLRKNCIVWVDCRHCSKKILVCPHIPQCIKFCDSYISQQEFLVKGICQEIITRNV
jgi:hypothetical protein